MNRDAAELTASRHLVVVNGTTYDNDDPRPTGRDVLNLAGLRPATEHQLILVKKNRTRLIGADDKLDLSDEQGGVFRAFRGDRTYSWTLDEVGQVWGVDALEVDELIALFSIGDDKELVLEREGEPDRVLRPGGTVSFAECGTEDIVTRRKQPELILVTVFTTAGVFPAEGALRVMPNTPVEDVLRRAARKLNLQDTTGWVVTVGSQDVDPGKSFAQNGLSGTVELNWTPREGGGGDA